MRVRRQQGAQRPDHVVPLERSGQQQGACLRGQIGVVDVPVLAILAADMAQRQVPGQFVETVGRRFRHHYRIPRSKRGIEPGRVIIARVEPFRTDRRNVSEQSAGIAHLPQGRRGGRDLDRSRRCRGGSSRPGFGKRRHRVACRCSRAALSARQLHRQSGGGDQCKRFPGNSHGLSSPPSGVGQSSLILCRSRNIQKMNGLGQWR